MADAPFVSLYRRFRPGRFDELRGQDHVVRALRSAVRDDRVSHAYLFSGPRGDSIGLSPVVGAAAGSCATSSCESSQGRKAAALSGFGRVP